jgi:hydrogenase maturation factor
MCFTIPKKITHLHGSTASIEGNETIDISGIENLSVGDYVFVTSGIAIAKLGLSEGASIRSLIKQTHDELS